MGDHSDERGWVILLESQNLLGQKVLHKAEAIVLVSGVTQNVWSGYLRHPDWVLLIWNALRIADIGHSNLLVWEVDVNVEFVVSWLVDLNRHADSLVLIGLVIWTGNVVIELGFSREVVRLVEGHRKRGRCAELNLSQRNVELPVRVRQVRLSANYTD